MPTDVTDVVMNRRRAVEMADKWLFFAVFVLGTGLMVLLKWQGLPQAVVTAVPVAAMLFYGGYVLVSPRYRLRDDRAGDSLYYLGFLYTMVSLAYSLAEFGEGGSETIVTNFGIALVTTILGLTLRVVYHQLRQDPFEAERHVRAELTEVAAKVHSELLQIVTDFNSLHKAITQSVDETVSGASEKMLESVQDSTTSYTTAVNDFSAHIREAASQLREQQDALTKAARRTAGAVDRLADRMDQIELPPELLRAKVEAVLGQFEGIVKTLADRAGTERTRMADLEKLVGSTLTLSTELNAQMKTLTSAASEQRQVIAHWVGDLDTAVKAIGVTAAQTVTGAQANMQAQMHMLSQLSTSSLEALRVVVDHRTRLEAELQASDRVLEQVGRSLVSLTRTIVEELDGK